MTIQTFYFSSRRTRGSVIVLVVAVLALLAVIGTVYIVSARAARSSATAGNVALNLDYAVDAVNKIAVARTVDSLYDSKGVVGGIDSTGTTYGKYATRRWTIPEVNPGSPGTSFYNGSLQDCTWLCSDLYRNLNYEASFSSSPPGDSYNDLTLVTPYIFNPQSGQYDNSKPNYYYFSPGTNAPNADAPPNSVPNSTRLGMFSTVIDPLPTGVFFPDGKSYSAEPDSFINLLPYSEANGVRYRFGLRILDTSRMANVNLGYAVASPVLDNNGEFYADYLLTNVYNSGDSASVANLHISRLGTSTAYTSPNPTPDIWGQIAMTFERPDYVAGLAPFEPVEELELRAYGDLGTTNTPRLASANVWPATFGTNNGTVRNPYRNYFTTYSYSRELRPFLINSDYYPSNTGSAFTTMPTAGWTIAMPSTVSTLGGYVWPQCPARIPVNFDFTSYNSAFSGAITDTKRSDYLAIAATNMATVMYRIGGYSLDESSSFAANYITFIWNDWTKNAAADGTPIWSMPKGPSFIDDQGICIRSYADNREYGSANDLKAATAGEVYLGFAAQPFLNEIAVHTKDSSGNNAIDDQAIEMYNPFNFALDLSDYELRVVSTSTTPPTVVATLDLSTLATAKYIPAGGFLVLTPSGGGNFGITLPAAGTPPNLVYTIDVWASMNLAGGDRLELARKFTPRGASTVAYAVIDQYNYSQALIANGQPTSTYPAGPYYVRRTNSGAPAGVVAGDWLATIDGAAAQVYHPQATDGPGEKLTLGSDNPTDTGVTAVPLYDDFPTVGMTSGAYMHFRNINQFNRIMRISNMNLLDTGTSTYHPVVVGAVSGHLAGQLNSITTSPPPAVTNCDFPSEAAIHFDFRADPSSFNSQAANTVYDPTLAAPAPFAAGPSGAKYGDARAQRVLDCLAFVDRYGLYELNLGDNSNFRGISKLRIPGQINVNTASAEVLTTLPFAASLTAAQKNQVIGAILAYRWRTTGSDPRIPSACQNPAVNFTAFPGYGIRSLGELDTALGVAATQIPLPAASTLDGRETVWASIYNYLTVRSDTFVVYGYLEAVRQHPRYGSLFKNDTDWYQNNYGTDITDDPTATGAKLLRLARRRWVAIVDTSECNFNRADLATPTTLNNDFAQPKIIAIKELPQ